ncbi:MAG: metallophosphoesterase family protein [Ktedonobacterales bacterium]
MDSLRAGLLMPDIHRIGVLSDTHIPKKAPRVPDAALRHFEEVELILHAGDISTLAVLDQLSAYAPVEAVQGNVELPEVIAALPLKREIVVGGCAIGVIHILGERTRHARNARLEFPTARVVIFGHSHIPYTEDVDGLLLLNPGSATVPPSLQASYVSAGTLDRRQLVCTIAMLTIEDGVPRAEIVAL